MADRVGQQLGNYRLVRLLGQGGFADVYLGEHIHLETQAAIKVLHTQLAGDEIEQFRLEAKRVAHLEHPHIVRVLEFGVEGTTPFLVMSYAPGGTLRTRHPRGSRLWLPTVISYVRQIVSALQYAHDQKLIHRDVKPENMLLGPHDEVLLTDFGIAVVVPSTRAQITQEGAGTIPYMAPEQIEGHPREASDQYALGVVVYEWLCGVRPFEGSLTEVMVQHLTTPPPPLHEKVATIPLEIEQVVLHALAKDPKQRFARIKEFADALEEKAKQVSPVPPTQPIPQPPPPGSQSTTIPQTALGSPNPPKPPKSLGFAAIVIVAVLVLLVGSSLLVYATVIQPQIPAQATATAQIQQTATWIVCCINPTQTAKTQDATATAQANATATAQAQTVIATAAPRVAITYPTDGSKVGSFITVQGTASNILAGKELWLFVTEENVSGYFPQLVGDTKNPSPIMVRSDGTWSVGATIGTPADVGKKFTLIPALLDHSDSSAHDAIKAYFQQTGQYKPIPALPSTIQLLAQDQVQVGRTWVATLASIV